MNNEVTTLKVSTFNWEQWFDIEYSEYWSDFAKYLGSNNYLTADILEKYSNVDLYYSLTWSGLITLSPIMLAAIHSGAFPRITELTIERLCNVSKKYFQTWSENIEKMPDSFRLDVIRAIIVAAERSASLYHLWDIAGAVLLWSGADPDDLVKREWTSMDP